MKHSLEDSEMIDDQLLRKQFEAEGYVAVPGFVSGQELAALRTNLDRFIREVVPTMTAEHAFFEDKDRRDTLKQLHEMHAYDPYFSDLLVSSPFQRLAETLLGGHVVAKTLQFFNKPPLTGQPTPPHQDGYYFMLEPCEAVTLWLALDTVDEENGCVRYVRGSHRRGLRNHSRTRVLGFSQGIVDYGQENDVANEVSVPAQPGDLLVHHALTIHRADGNRSANRTRRSLGFVYFAQCSRENFVAVRDYQEQLKVELTAADKI